LRVNWALIPPQPVCWTKAYPDTTEKKEHRVSKRANSKYKIDRRLRVNLWGRPKSPINKREYGPGQHGQGRQKPTDYRLQLMAKQRLKGYYGSVSERQLRRY
jgi:small subunit ribosomal protein S4